MFSKKTFKKVLICFCFATLIIEIFNIINHDISRSEALFMIFTIMLILLKPSGKKKLCSLSNEYKNCQQLLSEIFKYCPDLIFYKDLDFKYISCNKAFEKIIGLSPEEIIGHTDSDIFTDEVVKEARKNDKNIIKNKLAINYDQNITCMNGEVVAFNIIKTPLLNEFGQVIGILGIGRDVTYQKALNFTLQEKQFQINAILENMPFCAYVKDLKCNFIAGNQKLFELTGRTKEEFESKNMNEIFPPDILKDIEEEDRRVIENKETLRIEVRSSRDLGPQWLEINKAPIINNDGEVVGIVIVFRDIDIIKEVELQKETFVATLTHDLKVPTVAQIKALELLQKGIVGEINAEQDELIGQVLNSCRYMLNMISTLLSTYRYEGGVKKINREEFNFSELISECCNEIAYLAQEKNQKLVVKNDSPENVLIADKLEIKRVITNLLSNAISYSIKDSEIEISVKTSNDDITLLVNSVGAIIPQEELSKLFDKYVSNATKFRQVGLGLGLYLTKQIINAHNGEVIALSNEEFGNTFGFKIPKSYNKSQESALNSVHIDNN